MVRAIVVVGAGAAGMQTALALRENGYQQRLVLLGAEPHPPYDRPPLSKGVLLGKAEHSRFEVDYAALGVELLLGRPALGVDTAARTVRTGDGSGGDGPELAYDRLVLATGARPVALPGQPASAHLLRTHDDAVALRAALRPGARVVIVGAGWIGAEAATVARQLGCAVTVVEAGGSPLPGALPPEAGERMRSWYARAGVELRTGTAVSGFADGGVLLADGGELPAEVLLVGVGARPDTGWLDGSGIALDERGAVAVDDRLRASQDGVLAVGDCASFPSARYAARLTVHHWDNAMRGARVAAANALGGDEVYDPVPYFWSEQFGRMVQYAGWHRPGDELLWRGDPAEGTHGTDGTQGADGTDGWSALWLRGDVPVALLAVDRPRDLAQGRRLVERGAPLDRARAADPSVPLKAATTG
jgi:3-phenylpropionate/trans-cinnamate dioxygenase ferredoxin reductase component